MAKSKGIDPIAAILVAVIVIAFLLWKYVINPVITWFMANLLLIAITIIIGITVIGGSYIILERRNEQERREQEAIEAQRRLKEQRVQERIYEEQKRKREQFEADQKAKGLIPLIDRKGEERWGTPEEVAQWKKVDDDERQKESLYYRIVSEIKAFKPRKKYDLEREYHEALYAFLTAKFPNAKYEHALGGTRPDIVIENVAIEVKGPTLRQDLETLVLKCITYHNYCEKLIIVLFDPQYSQQFFEEISRGIKRDWPNVEIIVKPDLK